MTIEHVVRRPEKRARETPILFQHGAWHGAWCWSRFLDEFATRGYEARAISLPGHGETPLGKTHVNRYSLRDYVDCLEREVASVDPAPVVVGHSMGGAILQKLLERRALPAAVLLASVPSVGTLPLLGRWIVEKPRALLRTIAKRSPYEMVATPEAAQAAFLSPDADVDPAGLHSRLVPESFRVLLDLSLPWQIRPSRNRSPVLVVAAREDAIFPVREEEQTARAYGASCEVVPGAHDLMLEATWRDAVDRIDRWLREDVRVP